MFPLNDVEPNRYISFPFITVALICVNTLLFAFEFATLVNQDIPALILFFQLYGSVPELILSRQGGGALSTFTHMFLHGDPLHLLGNMLFLWAFGRRVEDACGPWRFLLFYLVCGVFADIVSTFIRFHFDRPGPGIGASGAIAGIMGAYVILFPGGRIRTLILLGFVPLWPKVRAIWLILLFIGLQFAPAFNLLLNQSNDRTNYWAHLGGFFGSLFVFLFLRPEVFHRYRNELPL